MDSTKLSKVISFNCKNVMRSLECIRRLCKEADIIALQETWLLPHDLPYLGTIDNNFAFTGTSAVDTSMGVLRGRPYGGVAILWRKNAFPCVTVVPCASVRLAAIKVVHRERQSTLIISVYMPTACVDNLSDFTDCLSEISALIVNSDVESVYVVGDFNAHPGELFANELINFCNEQMWSCIDMELLPVNTHTFVSDAHGCHRWLDHCLTTSAARRSIHNVSVLYGVYWSDHYPLCIECDFQLISSKVAAPIPSRNKYIWGERDQKQTKKYTEF